MKKNEMKICKFCGTEIAPNAKACPKCGGVIKKPHGCLVSLLVIVAVIVMAIIVISFGLKSAIKNSPQNSVAKVVTKSGNTVEISSKDMKKLYDTNKAKYDKEYYGAVIEFVGTIKQIDTNKSWNGDIYADYIVFEEGWELRMLHGAYSDLSTLNVGDKLKVISRVWNDNSYYWGNFTVSGVYKDGKKYTDVTVLTR